MLRLNFDCRAPKSYVLQIRLLLQFGRKLVAQLAPLREALVFGDIQLYEVPSQEHGHDGELSSPVATELLIDGELFDHPRRGGLSPLEVTVPPTGTVGKDILHVNVQLHVQKPAGHFPIKGAVRGGATIRHV